MISQFGENVSISSEELESLVFQCLETFFPDSGKKVLILPPDHTRLNSMAGPITAMVYEKLTSAGVQVDILPTLGTHNAMTEAQLRMMYGETIPLDAFKVHDWRNGIVRKGEVSGEMLSELSGGKVDYTVGVEVNKMPEKGIKKLAVVTPAFVSDCLETLEEIAMEASHEFKEHGGEEFKAIPCLNDDDEWCKTLSRWIDQWAFATS